LEALFFVFIFGMEQLRFDMKPGGRLAPTLA
jgi:hypothetical protein